MATIRARSSNWQAIVKRKGHPTLSKTFEQKKDAERWARQQERLMDTGQWIDHTEAEQTSLAKLLDRYSNEVSSTKRGAKAERNRIALLKRSNLAQHSVASITGQMVANWRDARLQAVSSGTVLRELSLLSHVFTVASREWGLALQSNPVKLIRKPPAGKPRDRILTKDERSRLINACGQCRNLWVQPVVVFALETAARRGETLTLRWSDVDLIHSTAKLNITKSGQPRTVPLSPACVSMLKSIPRDISGRVFPITMEALKQAYERAVKRAGLDDFTFHDLRHDALTRLAKMGFSVLELRAISGHTTANMLQRYVSIDASDLALKIASNNK